MKLTLTRLGVGAKASKLRALRKAITICTDTLPQFGEVLALYDAAEAGAAGQELGYGVEDEKAQRALNALTEADIEGLLEPDDEPDDEFDFGPTGDLVSTVVGPEVKLALLLVSVCDPAQALQLCQAFAAETEDDTWLRSATVILSTFLRRAGS